MNEDSIDTNIILEIMSQDISSDQRLIIENLIKKGGIVSAQVLNELVSVTQKWANKGKPGWSRKEVLELSEFVRASFTVVQQSDDTHPKALEIQEKYKLSWWDSLIVAVAVENGCPVLWSKDMHHGLVVEGVTTIQSPYK